MDDLNLLFGVLYVNTNNPKEAYVRLSAPILYYFESSEECKTSIIEKDLLISGYSQRGVAFDGDSVVVRINDPEKWIRCHDCSQSNNQEQICKACRATASVVDVESSVPVCVGALFTRTEDGEFTAIPFIPKYPPALVPSKEVESPYTGSAGKLYGLITYERRNESVKLKPKYFAHVKRLYTNASDGENVAPLLLACSGLDPEISEFTVKQLQSVSSTIDNMRKQISERKFKQKREIITEANVISVDPPNCRDRDDAFSLSLRLADGIVVSCEEKARIINGWLATKPEASAKHFRQLFAQFPSGTIIELGVHIADVSQIVTPNCSIEKHVQERPVSYYLHNLVFHMLPEQLSSDFLSLVRGEKIAFTVLLRFNQALELQERRFFKSLIDVKYDIEYSAAERILGDRLGDLFLAASAANNSGMQADVENDELRSILENDSHHTLAVGSRKRLCANIKESTTESSKYSFNHLSNDLVLMFALASIIDGDMCDKGYLDLNSSKIYAIYGKDDFVAQGFCHSEKFLSHRLVSTFMILANRVVAEILVSEKAKFPLLRRHDMIESDKLAKLISIIRPMVDGESSALLSDPSKFLAVVYKISTEYPLLESSALCNLVVTYLQAAEYEFMYPEVAAARQPTYYRHFALNLDWYTHFTSPIRRYSDILVHRALSALYSSDYPQITWSEALNNSVSQMNKVTKAARNLNSVVMEYTVFAYCERATKPVVFRGLVVDVSTSRATIYVFGINKNYHLDYYCKMGDDHLQQIFDEKYTSQVEIPRRFVRKNDTNSVDFFYSDEKIYTLTPNARVLCYLFPKKNTVASLAILLVPKLIK